ncbi:hypothetical protein B0H13DRAFT_2349617 [Mycena leptocephala]|nr:hypothetical protein B0H13DRAFT_2349617 [Mycena leptocephala]
MPRRTSTSSNRARPLPRLVYNKDGFITSADIEEDAAAWDALAAVSNDTQSGAATDLPDSAADDDALSVPVLTWGDPTGWDDDMGNWGQSLDDLPANPPWGDGTDWGTSPVNPTPPPQPPSQADVELSAASATFEYDPSWGRQPNDGTPWGKGGWDEDLRIPPHLIGPASDSTGEDPTPPMERLSRPPPPMVRFR